MKVTVSELRIIGKNYRQGENSKGPWEMFELECANGEGSSVRLNASKELFDSVIPFAEYTGEVDLFQRGYNLGGELLKVWED